MHEYRDFGKRPPAVTVEARGDGTLLLRSPYQPLPRAQSIPHILMARAAAHPERTLLAERGADGAWLHLDYGRAVANCRSVAAHLLARDIEPDRSVMILSPRSFGHFALAYGAMLARVPVAPVSTPYSLLSNDHGKLLHVAGLVKPRVVMVDDIVAYAPALGSLMKAGLLDDAEIVLTRPGPGGEHSRSWRNVPVSVIDDWYGAAATSAVDASVQAIDHATVARYMFTSGSTGMPKGVIYTQGMMCAQLAQSAGLNRPDAPPDAREPARVLEWMPWSHTGAGVMRLNGMIDSGGSIYFDTGRPVPGEYGETLRNLREVRPTVLSGAPVGYVMLADALEKDEELNRLVLGSVTAMQFGSAAMAPALFERLQALSVKASGSRIGIVSSLASTEVLGCLSVYWPMEEPGNIGLPVPGNEVKLVPTAGRLEIRVKGNVVTPGYLGDPEKSAASFDQEGFFLMGDAVRFLDPARPERGLAFDGRIAEQFKLVTGTWVSAGTLRTQVVTATSPLIRDAVICGLNQSYVAVMLWPNMPACAELLGLDPVTAMQQVAEVLASPALVGAVREGLLRHNAVQQGSSTRIERFTLLEEPPSVEGHEITEKGYVNQRATLERRSAIVERLYAGSEVSGVHGV